METKSHKFQTKMFYIKKIYETQSADKCEWGGNSAVALLCNKKRGKISHTSDKVLNNPERFFSVTTV